MSFFGDDSDTNYTFSDTVHQYCVDASDVVGDATSWMYETIAARGLPEQEAAIVGEVVGGFVNENWEHVCDLPANISDSFSNPSE
jgi:hypothetical protein